MFRFNVIKNKHKKHKKIKTIKLQGASTFFHYIVKHFYSIFPKNKLKIQTLIKHKKLKSIYNAFKAKKILKPVKLKKKILNTRKT